MFEAIIALGIAYGFYKLFELFVRRKERMAIIEKMSIGDGMITLPDVTKWFSSSMPTSWALRLGALLTGLGLGLSIAVIMNYCMQFQRNEQDVLYFASMLLFGGLGLVIAYLLEQKKQNKG
jgi:hypothetical protein